ncbi:hypothetical protein [Flammeovirga kamogawensis]|uniref:Uncharacterized protein n=1 Tax=Flammeovirga kamogawensis TaxID=373891 RepID=A0ABX8H2D5_9BACT|nr:hypothetical protein [Flammeovirga kamogawensis]MBB6463751.1 hypothetical protein [Flammeovirga kamogawensis]QWG09737.1 hypothetical protein KM029_24370 [Flammeovirga kamogawensis]TRX65250.1 hypothetical protein EO216_22260 [Flammeovirga kamogawensis]
MTKQELKEYVLNEQLTNITNALKNMYSRTQAFYFQVTTTFTIAENGRYEVSTPDNFPVFTPKGQGFLEDGGDYFRGELKLRDLSKEDPKQMALDLIEVTLGNA